jgi:mono/diheme cytochrome c family protein
VIPSPEEIAEATAAVTATAVAQLTAEAAPAAAQVRGDVRRGQLQFMTRCAGCHRAGGQGPAILQPGSPGADVSPESLLPLIREGTGHGDAPTFTQTEITDGQIVDLAAYIRAQASP